VVHPLPSGAVKPHPGEIYQPGANTELYQEARLTCYETKTKRCGSSTRLTALLGLGEIYQPGAKIGLNQDSRTDVTHGFLQVVAEVRGERR
jgi:hypothetical protein